MKNTEIIETLKNTYPRDIRKKIVKTLLTEEKEHDKADYTLINQIFSYVLNQLGWNMVENTEQWDNKPLEVMKESFPKIESTKWYQEQILTTTKMIEVEMKA